FEQVNSNRPLRKSFDRSFIIAPAPPSSQAAIHGWKCLIISDQLTIRQYNGSDAWKPEPDATPAPVALVAPIPGALPPTAIAPVAAPAVVATPASNTGVAAQQVPMPGISPEQHAKAIELQGRTGLTYPYAVQCLSAVGWDIQAGITLVEQERANIPADAWQQPPAQF
ncbi:nuclear mRNA export, poly(A)+RNA binding protein, partial [Lunasporangiospora selenospora]